MSLASPSQSLARVQGLATSHQFRRRFPTTSDQAALRDVLARLDRYEATLGDLVELCECCPVCDGAREALGVPCECCAGTGEHCNASGLIPLVQALLDPESEAQP